MVRREFQRPAAAAEGNPPRRLEDWSDLVAAGHRMGSSSPRLTILEFADFECPACRSIESSILGPFLAEHPQDVAVVFRHWPLDYHRFAIPAAIAGECADRQGRFEAFYRVAYAKQDSLGLKTFASFAEDALVPDAAAFAACLEDSTAMVRIRQDAKVALALGGRGTPTIAVNGWLFLHPPTRTQLDSALTAARKES